MKIPTLLDKIKEIFNLKDIVYKITLPIYLWSIGYKTLDEYLDRIEEEYEKYKSPTADKKG